MSRGDILVDVWTFEKGETRTASRFGGAGTNLRNFEFSRHCCHLLLNKECREGGLIEPKTDPIVRKVPNAPDKTDAKSDIDDQFANHQFEWAADVPETMGKSRCHCGGLAEGH